MRAYRQSRVIASYGDYEVPAYPGKWNESRCAYSLSTSLGLHLENTTSLFSSPQAPRAAKKPFGFGTEPRYRIYASSIILQRSQTLHTSHQVMTDTNQTHYYVPTGHGNHAKACSHDVLCTRARPASQFESIPEVYRRWFSHVGPVSVCASVVHPCPAHAPSCQRAQESWYGCLMVWYELLVVLWYGMVWVRRVSFPRRRPTVTLVAGEVDMRPLLPLVARVRAARR